MRAPLPNRPERHAGRRLVWSVVVTAALLGAGDHHAQRAGIAVSAAQLDEPETITLDVAVANGAQPARGLGADAFALQVDGRPVTIEAVRELDGDVGRRFLVFVDDVFTVPSQRDRMLQAIEAQLDRLGTEDRLALAAFDGERVTVLTPWARALPRLRSGFAAARARPSQGLQRLAEQRQLEASQRLSGRLPGTPTSFSGIGFSGSTSSESGALDLRRARRFTARIDGVMRAAAATLEALPGATPDGPRAVLLLSGSWPLSPDRWVADDDAGAPMTGMIGARRLLAPLVEAGDRHRFAVYPVWVPVADPAGWRRRPGRDRTALGEDPLAAELLRTLAADTGGRALLDGVGDDVLGQVATDLRHRYRLRFTPTWRGDDGRRALRVSVPNQGFKVVAPTGFADLARGTRILRRVESAEWLQEPLPGVGALAVRLGPGERAGGGRLAVPMAVEIPPGIFAGTSAEPSALELRVLARDGEALWQEQIRWSGGDESYLHRASLRLGRGTRELLVSVYDPRDGTLLTQQARFDPAFSG